MKISGGVQAWVTTAVEDKSVAKAIVLAGSLRRVRTAKKLAVFTILAVSKELREKLKEVFDLVLLLEQEIPNGLSLDDYAKIQGFSLLIFNKCVFLSSNTLVLKNCDEMFEKYAAFAACTKGEGEGEEVDSSVYLFTPSMNCGKALEGSVHCFHGSGGKSSRERFYKFFNSWMKNNIANFERLDEKYNLPIDLDDCSGMGLEVDLTIANFIGAHPLDLSEGRLMSKLVMFSPLEKFVVDHCLQIYSENVTNSIFGSPLPLNRVYENEPIAIVGMSFRLPGGNNVDEFWDLLVNGREAIQPVPPFRWTKEHTTIPCKNRKFEAGFLSVPVDEFDAKFFGLSPKEAIFLDPQQRLLHEVSWEAMEDAMIDPLKLHGTQTGVFVGSWIYDYKDIAVRSSDVDFFRVYMGTSLASEAARLSHFYGTTGPSIATESGCSSAIVALHMACKSLRSHESNMALACGVNLLLHPQDLSHLSFVVAPDGRCKTFDTNANGFGRAEGCAVLLLKRYSDAMRDEDKIWGLIRGTGVTQEGVSKSLGTPTVQCESLAMELALQDASVDPADVSYIEAHGTGTTVGDPMEVAAITKAYHARNGRSTPLMIGSVKTNVGHTESVSGITGIIKVLLSMKNETIPPHLNLKTINPEINLDVIPAEIPTSAVAWPKEANKPRLAGVSSFGISGTDGHALIEEAPVFSKESVDFQHERPLHIMKISAKCQESLEELLKKYESIFAEKEANGTDQDFANIAFSANFGRAVFNHRAVFQAKNFSEAKKIIQEKRYKCADVQSTGQQLCFLFTGQGSQYPKMAANLYSTSPIFKFHFDKCSELLQMQYGISIKDVLWGDSSNGDELSRTLFSQTSIFCVEYCLLKLWESWGVKPDFVMGHSLGEFAAAVAAGALSFEDALMLVAERSRLIDNLPRGKMLVIKADKSTVDQTIMKCKSHPDFWVDYAALNSPDQTVVAGDFTHIEAFAKFCDEKKLKSIVLASTHAFHSRHMDPILEAYRRIALAVKRPTRVNESFPKYISGMEGRLVELDGINADYWVRHTREKVSFIDACKVAEKEGCTLFLEVGPHPVLSALAMMNIEGQSVKCLPSLRRKEDEWTTLLDSLNKLFLSEWKGEIDWKGFDRCYQRQAVKIPFYQFNRKSIWTKTRPVLADLHPLLGKVVPNASGFSVFEQNITIKKTEFVQDHVIGNTMVFPGAGFLEMCLVGGHSCVQGFGDTFSHPRRPVVLKDLKIKAPLALQDSQLCILQTVAGLDESNEEEMGYTVNISRIDLSDSASGGQWISHASAKFLPVVPSLPQEISEFNILEAQQSWEKVDNKDFYEKLPEVGLRFGPKFQSLQNGLKNETGVLLQVKVPAGTEPYVIHPVVADAMIQAAMLWTSKDKIKKKLQVPVHIGEFIWLNSLSDSPNLYIFCSTKENGSTYSLLVNSQGTPVAYMSDIDFAETNVKLIEGMIHQQAAAMPQLWEEIWKPQVGPMQKRIQMEKMDPPIPDLMTQFIEAGNNISKEEIEFYSLLCRISTWHVLNSLYTLGWNPIPGQSFTVQKILESLSIQPNFHNYIRFFLRLASESGYLEKLEDGNTFSPTVNLPTGSQLGNLLSQPVKQSFAERIEYRIMTELGNHMNEFFTGKAEVLNHLFPSDPSKPHAQELYMKLGNHAFETIVNVNADYFSPHMLEFIEKSKLTSKTGEIPVFRVLEVGAGTGSFSTKFLSEFKERNMNVEYHFTDISAVFFGPAEKLLEEHLKSIVFKKFNMEEDPFQQGFCPEYFDMILACEVIHVAKELKPVLQNLRKLLKPNGMLEIYETVRSCPRITFIFGMLDAYWQFKDYDLRPDHISLSMEKWEGAFKATGFDNVTCVPVYNNVHAFMLAQASDYRLEAIDCNNYTGPEAFSWVIFCDEGSSDLAKELTRKLKSINRKVLAVPRPVGLTEGSTKSLMDNAMASGLEGVKLLEGVIYLWGMVNRPGNRDQTQISLPLVTLCQIVLVMEKQPKVCVFTQGIHSVNGSDVLDPTAGTLIGIIRSIRNEQLSFKISLVDLSPNESPTEQADEAFYNLWAENDGTVALSSGKRVSPKISSWRTPIENLPLPNGCDRFQLILPSSKMISDLEFGYLDAYSLGEKEIEVKVKAMALNFRDVFCVLKPLPIFEEMNSVGLDFAGVVCRVGKDVTKVKIGDRVIGMNMSNNLSLPSHIKIEENLVADIPHDMTFNEGVTLPAVFSTAVYCLINVAKIKKGDTILIHTASGGVGLCAIQLAQQIGANIIATAGSTRKRSYLRSQGIEHVFNSRTTDFGKQILEETNGRGVDIVLNSITGDGFKEASLGALIKNGRFIEMSKLNVWKEEEVKESRPDVFYRVVDLTSLKKHQYAELSETLKDYLKGNSIKPIAYERFDALNIRGALNYLQRAKHVGKIVCVMPEVKVEKSKLAVFTPLFNDDSTYLVTGGLGGIGLEVVKWMLENGAKHIAIASRSPPKPETVQLMEMWKKNGKHVEAFQVDVGNYDQCKQLFELFSSSENHFPRLRGVMHAAGVLHDCALDNMTWDWFLHTYNPKVNGSWNLHDLTKDLLLEHFVLFSSIAASFGSPGQTNHSASNSFEDTLAHYRKSIGLPCISVNWGIWGEVGVATEVDFPGVRPIATSQGLLALETFLKTQSSHIVVLNVESFAMLAKLLVGVKTYVDDKRLLGETKIYVAVNADQFWAEVDKAECREEKVEVFKKFIKSTIRLTLKMEEDEPIDDNAEFQVLGVDSLMMLEMKNALQNVLGSRMTVSAAQLKDCNNSIVLANKLVDILEGETESEIILPTTEELSALVREDSILPESVTVTEKLTRKNITQVETVLLIGVTGNLGPYLLHDLSKRPQIKKIYCLIRKTGQTTPSERLHSKLEKIYLLEEIDMEKVECIQGDITDSRFGLPEDLYNKLAAEVDAIFHSAVRADHTAKYWKVPPSKKNNVRTVNVLGTVHILEFATTSVLKSVFYASTLLTVPTLDEDGCISEEWEDVGAFDNVLKFNTGYPISKHIAEQLIKQAVQRGVPVKVFRLPAISGDSRTGRHDFETNHVVLRWLSYMKLGCMPDIPVPQPLLPVDHCAKLSLDIFFNPETNWDVYNVCMRGTRIEQHLIQVASDFGVIIEPIPFPEFVEKLKLEKDDSPLAPFKKIYEDEGSSYYENFGIGNQSSSYAQKFIENSNDFYRSCKLLKLMPNYEDELDSNYAVMKRDLQFLKELGIFKKFGITEK